MPWFRWKAKQEPWGDNFSIVVVKLADTGPDEPKVYTVPYDQHLQLIGCGIQFNPGVLPSTTWTFVYARRGGELLHYSFSPLQGAVVGISHCWLGVGLVWKLERTATPRGTGPLADYFYLYPHDQVIISAIDVGGPTGTLLDCSFTFKQWMTG